MQYKITQRILFDRCDKRMWLQLISDVCRSILPADDTLSCISIDLDENVEKKKFLPFHLVALSCFIDFLKKKNYWIYLIIENNELRDFLQNDAQLVEYWQQKSNHLESPDPLRFNLWRVVEPKAVEYKECVHRYFNSLFPEKDFTMLNTCLGELYYNVFDHSDAGEVAFSYIHYDREDRIIHIAICDFGKGICRTLREAYKNIVSDEEALKKSLEKGITARSNAHNAGFGLDNVISTLSDNSTMRIVSNEALLLCMKIGNKVEVKTFTLPFAFNGTMVYFDLSIDDFEQTEVEDVFVL